MIRLIRCFSGLFAGLILSSCAPSWQSAVEDGRRQFNQAISNSSQEEILRNLVRVSRNEIVTFSDISQISGLLSVKGALGGQVSGIGSGFFLGALNPLVELSSSPTITYSPLRGAALTTQLATPISIQSIINLISSNARPAAVFSLLVNEIAPSPGNFGPALNIMLELFQENYISVRSVQQDPKKPSELGLVFRLARNQLRARERGGDPDYAEAKKFWCRLVNIANHESDFCTNNSTQRSSRARNSQWADILPLRAINTRSAYGMLSFSFEKPRPLFSIVSEIEYRDIVRLNALPYLTSNVSSTPNPNLALCVDDGFYYLLPPTIPTISPVYSSAVEDDRDFPRPPAVSEERGPFDERERATATFLIEKLANGQCPLTAQSMSSSDSARNQQNYRIDQRLNSLRRYLLIVRSQTRPQNALLSTFMMPYWYSVMNDDVISKRNFVLVQQVIAVQSVEQSTPPPAIVLGGR